MKKLLVTFLALFMVISLFTGCSNKNQGQVVKGDAPAVGNLTYDYSLKLEYAVSFSVDYFKDGYVLLTVSGKEKYLVIPEGKQVPTGLTSDIVVLKKPFTGVYMANSPSVTLINTMKSLNMVTFTGTEQSEWYIDDIVAAMKAGTLKFGGKYNTPDYEMLTAAKCNLVLESTMVNGVPEVTKKFTELGIPILIDRSGEESHPLGRVEWAKFYAALLGIDMSKANDLFNAQAKVVKEFSKDQSTEKSVAIFYITTKGAVYVRNTDDYLTKMVELAGGKYIMDKMQNSGSNSTAMDMESFYTQAKDADYIIYIYSIGGKPDTLAKLVEKNKLLSDFKAVKDGNVWATCQEFFQVGDVLGNMIGDIHTILTAKDSNLTKLDYLFKLQ